MKQLKQDSREIKGYWRYQCPLVPQWENLGIGLLVGIIFRSPFYFYRPPPIVTREDISDFFHSFDD